MPRQRRNAMPPARNAPLRPTAATTHPSTTSINQQHRPASTTAHDSISGQQHSRGNQGPGLLGQMASTAAGVAVGSSIGHAIGGFFGGSSAQAAENQSLDSAGQGQPGHASYQNTSYMGCEDSAKAFTKCLDDNAGPHAMSVCSYYLEQLKACQAASRTY